MLANKRRHILILILAALGFWRVTANGQTGYPPLQIPEFHSPAKLPDVLICRLPGIEGFDATALIAKRYVGFPTTSVPSETKVFITVANNRLYLHSNFLTRGADNPTKIETSKTDVDLERLAFNLIGKESESGISQDDFLSAFPDMHFIVDQKLFSDPTYGKLDFNNVPHVEVIGKDGIVRESVEISLPADQPKRLVRFGTNLYARVDDSSAPATFKRLDEDELDVGSIKLLSLVINTDTDSAIAALPPSRVVDSGDKKLETVKKALQQENGKNVFVLGHIENDSFVTLDSAGAEVSRIRMSDLDEISKEAHVRLFPLGCNSASVHPTGVAATFNTVDAVKHFSAALSSVTWSGFYTKLSSPDLMLVLDSSVLAPDGSTKVVFNVHPETGSEEPLGTVTHYLAPVSPAPITSSSTTNSSTDSSSDDDGGGIFYAIFWIACLGLVTFFVIRTLRRG